MANNGMNFESLLDLYSEEERTFDFGEEEPFSLMVASNHFSTIGYDGEDFSRYMNDDDGIVTEYSTPHREFDASLQSYEDNYYDIIPDPLMTNYQQDHSETPHVQQQVTKDPKKLKKLMAHVSKVTNTSHTKTNSANRRFAAHDDNPIKIHNFSFADSKMGYSFAASVQEKQHTSETSEDNTDSGIGLDINSDIRDLIKELPGFQKSSWWSLGTLSSRLTSGPDVVSSFKRHSSSPSIVDPIATPMSQCAKNNRSKTKSISTVSSMWKKVTTTISSKRKPDLRVKTEEIHF